MTRQEYDKAKQECKKDLRNKLMLGNLQGDPFSATFDRAYALGKQTETITQEDVEKAAEAFATPPIGNGGMFTRQQVKGLLVKFASLFPGKQVKDAEDTVIQGWVCRDKKGNALNIHAEKPYRAQSGYDVSNEPDWWESDCASFLPLDKNLFLDLSWNNDPIEVEIIIKRKKKWMTL